MFLSRRHFITTSASLSLFKTNLLAHTYQIPGLKDFFKNDFLIGAAVTADSLISSQTAPPNASTENTHMTTLITQEFNALTLENEMKWNYLQAQENHWEWDKADAFVNFCQTHGLYSLGHTLVWHEQLPQWIFQTKSGQTPSSDRLKRHLLTHIGQVVTRYQGKIKAWDVVNEALDGGSWRRTPWYNTLGDHYFHTAFNAAFEADPDACLIYNDYNLEEPAKLSALLNLLRICKQRKTPVHAVGLQCHMGLDYPSLTLLEQCLIALANAGVRLHITELDVDVLPFNWTNPDANVSRHYKYSAELDPYTSGLPRMLQQRLTQRYVDIFRLLLKHQDKIDRVTFWGLGDGDSWKNNFPIPGRTNHPLLFDRQYHKKPCYDALAQLKN